MNQEREHFSRLANLQRADGQIGRVLRRYPDLIRPADSDAEWRFDYQKERQDPKRLSLPDPWLFLIKAPVVTEPDRAIFRAAQSQLKALHFLVRVAHGDASLHTDWTEEMDKAYTDCDERRFWHAAETVAGARAKFELFQYLIQAPDVDPQFREWGQKQIEKSKAERRKRGQGKEFEPLPSPRKFKEGYFMVPCALVDWWVTGPSGIPGLMFWGNSAITNLFSNICGSPLKAHNVKKLRRELRLIPTSAESETPAVWRIEVSRHNETEWKIVLWHRDDSRAHSFWGPIHFNQKQILPSQQLPVATL